MFRMELVERRQVEWRFCDKAGCAVEVVRSEVS